MDPNLASPTTLDTIADLLTGSVLAAVTGLSAAGVGVALYSARRRATWHRVGAELGLRQETSGRLLLGALPALSGIYRGRAIEASLLPSSQTRISVRVANPRHLLDLIRADDTDALAGALWLTARQRTGIGDLRDSLRRPNGSIAVKGNFVTLVAPAGRARWRQEQKIQKHRGAPARASRPCSRHRRKRRCRQRRVRRYPRSRTPPLRAGNGRGTAGVRAKSYPGYQTTRASPSARSYPHDASISRLVSYSGRQPNKNLALSLSSQVEWKGVGTSTVGKPRVRAR